MSIFVRARFDAHDQRRAEFEELALALQEQVKEEPGTLTYRWFSAGAGSYLVIEEYTDDEAVAVHQERSAELLERAGQFADLVYAEIHGTVGPEIRAWAEARPQVTVFPDFPGHGGTES
ncbi:putative quinol monooxygenase [Streptomyces sp. R41]|uniref:Quinol monooxygenase n=1 Tax=Streptomyces sp. R41 TaxID=3238632 RepID=A0AB39R8I5_9ACTN